ncbi:hypothetical protein BH11PSE7_BH11PSE7_11270 [soil metagenome]
MKALTLAAAVAAALATVGSLATAATTGTAATLSATLSASPAAASAPAPSSRPSSAIITADQASLRAAPRDSAQQQAQLWQGEIVEVRGERLDYLQVWDHKRERGGYVRASLVRRTTLSAAEAPELLAVLRHVQGSPGNEALGIGLAAAWLKAAPAQDVQGAGGIEAFDALGTLADRLARRASSGAAQGKSAEAALSAQLDVAAQYGVQFSTFESEGRVQVCYNGEAFRRVLAMKSAPEQQARAALALTRSECVDPALRPLERGKLDAWRADVLDKVDAGALPGYLKNRVQMRRAGIWSSLTFLQARQGQPADSAARRALEAMVAMNKAELTDDDLAGYNDAAMRVNAVRWAAVPLGASASPTPSRGTRVVTSAGQPGETCVLLVDARNDEAAPLFKRCTYAVVWPQSATLSREGTALALAVQPTEAWRELWVFRREGPGWTLDVLPPAATSPGLGYAEFAGWVPGGTQMLVAREARGEGRYKHNFEVMSVAGLTTERQAGDPRLLGAFQRWEDPSWKRLSVSVR